MSKLACHALAVDFGEQRVQSSVAVSIVLISSVS